MNDQFAKAVRNLYKAARPTSIEIDGYAGYAAAVFLIDRPGRPGLWFVVDYRRELVRRICTY